MGDNQDHLDHNFQTLHAPIFWCLDQLKKVPWHAYPQSEDAWRVPPRLGFHDD